MNSATYHVRVAFMFVLFSFASAATPQYSDHFCTDGSYYLPKSTYESNLNVFLSSLVSNATLHDGFYRTTVAGGEIKGFFLCRGDVNASVCRDCVSEAATEIRRRCTNQTESIIWYDECTLRYTNDSYLNINVPSVSLQDDKNVSASDLNQFSDLVAATLEAVTDQAANIRSGKKFATKEALFKGSQKIYTLAQCTPELSYFDCNMCFRSGISFLPTCCDGKQGARVLLPSCNIRYETYQFYDSSASSTEPVLPPTSSGTEGKRKRRLAMILLIVVGTSVSLSGMLFYFGYYYLLRRKAKKSHIFVENCAYRLLEN